MYSLNMTPLVLCGPSGSGKSTLIKMLMAEFNGKFGFSVSHTTRLPRIGEEDGRDYHFVSEHEMEKMKQRGEFLEWAKFSGNTYGTSRKSVENVMEKGKICILDIDVKGVRTIKTTDFTARYVFIKPPSLEELETRLRHRKTETEESLLKRLAAANEEMEYGETDGNFDVVITNDDKEKAYQQLKDFIFT